MNIEKNEFWQNGYKLFKGFFDKSVIEQIQLEAKDVIKRQLVSVGLLDSKNEVISETDFNLLFYKLFENYPERVISSGKHIQHMISLHRISLDSKIELKLKSLGLGFPNICTRPMLFFNAKKLAKKEVYWKTAPHQDWRSMQGSLNSIVVWLPLVDIAKDLGALEIVPKSHLLGLNTSGFEDGFGTLDTNEVDKYSWYPVEVETGDALFFSSMLYHRSGSNTTENGIRWSCHFRYNDLDEKSFINRGFPHPYVYYPNPDIITQDFPLEADIQKAFTKV